MATSSTRRWTGPRSGLISPRCGAPRWPEPARSSECGSSSSASSTLGCPKAIRECRPHVILPYDERGGYPHPDHVKTHEVCVEAFDAAADPDRHPDCGEPWQPLKLYYFASFHRARFVALHQEMERRGLESPYAERMASWDDEEPQRPELKITTRVPCGEYFEIRDRALLAHATQIDPESSWFACPVDVQRAAWPTEDFHLARSLVDTEIPEEDLFAGVREKVSL